MASEKTIEIPDVQIAFPGLNQTPSTAIAVPEPPAAPTVQGMQAYAATPQTRDQLDCSALLTGATLVRARQEAEQLYRDSLQDWTKLMPYGKDALDGVNRLVDQALKEVEPIRVPELHAAMRELNLKMSSIKGKYDVSDPKVKQEYNDFLNGTKRFLHKVRDFLAMMKADVLSIETQLNMLSTQMAGKQVDMVRNVKFYNLLYGENNGSIDQLIYKIGVMQLVSEIGRADAASIPIGDAQRGDRGEAERTLRTNLISNLDIKIADYKGRLWVAWAFGPRLLMMSNLDVGLANKIAFLVDVTIPVMKQVLLDMRMMLASFENAQQIQVITATSNMYLDQLFKQGAVMMPAIAEAINQPTFWPSTMRSITDSLEQTAAGILSAYQAGEQRRAEADQEMRSSQELLTGAAGRLNDAIINGVVGSATKPLPIEITTTVPKALPSAG